MESKYRGISHSVGIYLLFFLHDSYDMRGRGIKKEQRLAPTFVNLKSNTMKNTLQRYGLLLNLQIIQIKRYVL